MAYRLSREPAVRRKIREVFRNHAKIRVYPTKKGLVTIDDSHPLYPKRYLKGKPVRDLEGTEYLQFQAVNIAWLDICYLRFRLGKGKRLVKSGDLHRRSNRGTQDQQRLCYRGHSPWRLFPNGRNNRPLDEVEWVASEIADQVCQFALPISCQGNPWAPVGRSQKLCSSGGFPPSNSFFTFQFQEARDYFERRISPGRCLPSKGGKKEEGDEEEEAENIEDDNPDAPIIAIALAPESPDEATVVILDQHGLVVDTCSIPLKNRFDHPHTEVGSKLNSSKCN